MCKAMQKYFPATEYSTVVICRNPKCSFFKTSGRGSTEEEALLDFAEKLKQTTKWKQMTLGATTKNQSKKDPVESVDNAENASTSNKATE